jgi:hypothetical protein
VGFELTTVVLPQDNIIENWNGLCDSVVYKTIFVLI